MGLHESEYFIVGVIIFLAALTQSLTGFGFGIVAMSFLPRVISLQAAVPLVALVGITLNLLIWYHYRSDCNFKAVGQLTIASLIATPAGTLLLGRIPEGTALKGLGILIVSYVLYDWFNLSLPSLKSNIWALIFGGASGVLNGAYTIGGPPIIMYANCRRWTSEEFKGNLTAIFFFGSLLAAIAHGWQGNITLSVGRFAVCSLPGFVCGLWLGRILSQKMNPLAFKQVTLALLMLAGLRLLI